MINTGGVKWFSPTTSWQTIAIYDLLGEFDVHWSHEQHHIDQWLCIGEECPFCSRYRETHDQKDKSIHRHFYDVYNYTTDQRLIWQMGNMVNEDLEVTTKNIADMVASGFGATSKKHRQDADAWLHTTPRVYNVCRTGFGLNTKFYVQAAILSSRNERNDRGVLIQLRRSLLPAAKLTMPSYEDLIEVCQPSILDVLQEVY